MELAEAQYPGHFCLGIGEFGAAYRSMENHGREKDAQDAVVADFQAKRTRHFDRCFEDDGFDYFSEEDGDFKKKRQYNIPGHLLLFLKQKRQTC